MGETAFKELPGWVLCVLKKKKTQHRAQKPLRSAAKVDHDTLHRVIKNKGGSTFVVDRIVTAVEKETNPQEITVWKISELVDQHGSMIAGLIPGASDAKMLKQAKVWIMRRQNKPREAISKVLGYASPSGPTMAEAKVYEAMDAYPLFSRAILELEKKIKNG